MRFSITYLCFGLAPHLFLLLALLGWWSRSLEESEERPRGPALLVRGGRSAIVWCLFRRSIRLSSNWGVRSGQRVPFLEMRRTSLFVQSVTSLELCLPSVLTLQDSEQTVSKQGGGWRGGTCDVDTDQVTSRHPISPWTWHVVGHAGGI